MEDKALDQAILSGLSEIRERQQDIRERVIKVEVMLNELTDDVRDVRQTLRVHESRIKELESHKAATVGAKDIVAWLAIAGLMLWEVLKK